MARIRTVKPEVAKHELLFELERQSGFNIRFAWCVLFTIADREGRFKWRPRALKSEVLPFDDVDFGQVLETLERGGLIVRYEVDGEIYGYIPTWKKHQSINQREAPSQIPAPPGDAENMHARARTVITEYEPCGVNVPAPLRQQVFERDGFKCLRCGCRDDLTIDHIFPQSIGGTHAILNLRTLCRSCNSGRPVQGQALVEDLAKDGFTLDDMKRICTHVHARGEGKGREGKGRIPPNPPEGGASAVDGGRPRSGAEHAWRDVTECDPQAYQAWLAYREEAGDSVPPSVRIQHAKFLGGKGTPEHQRAFVDELIRRQFKRLHDPFHPVGSKPKRDEPPYREPPDALDVARRKGLID